MIVHEVVIVKVCDVDGDSLLSLLLYIFEIFHRIKRFLKNQNNYTTNSNKTILPTEQSVSVLKSHIIYWDTWPDHAMEKFWRNSEATLG